MLYGAIFGFISIAFGMLLYFMRRDNNELGEKEETAKVLNNMLDEVKRAKVARDNLSANPNSDAAKLLRDKYTRQ